MKRINEFLGASNPADNSLTLIHVNLVVYALCFWIQQPVLPEKLKSLGASELDFGAIQSISSIVSLLGSTLFGRIVDVQGGRFGLGLAQLSSAAIYLISSIAPNLYVYYLTCVFHVFQHAMICCSTVISTLSTEEERAVALGRLSMSYGLGMVVGSSVGGYVGSNVSPDASLFLSGVISLAIVAFNHVLVPSLLPPQDKEKEEQTHGWMNVKVIWQVATSSRRMVDVLATTLLSSLGASAFRAMFSLAAVEEYNLSSKELGYLMSFTAVVAFITNVFILGWVVQLLGEYWSVIVSMFIQSVCFMGVYFVGQDALGLILITVFQSASSTIFYTLSATLTTKCATTQDQGVAISLNHASRTFTQVVSPVMGAAVMRRYQFGGVGLLTAFLNALGAMYAFATLREIRRDLVVGEGIVMEEKTRTE